MRSVIKFILNPMPFYSVARGRISGVYSTWPQCEAQVKGFTSPIFRKFSTYDEAVNFVINKGGKMDHKIDIAEQGLSEKGNKRSNPDENVATKSNKKLKMQNSCDKTLTRQKKYGEHTFLEDEDGYVHVYTDGSCEGNGTTTAVAGLGVYFDEGHALNVAKPVSGRATNNCGEIQASTLAIKLAGDCGIPKLCINTDSQFLINSVTKWMQGWKRNGWRIKSGEPVKNISDFKQLDEIKSKYTITLKWNYVKAHCGILGNERADVLAKQGGEMYRAGLRS